MKFKFHIPVSKILYNIFLSAEIIFVIVLFYVLVIEMTGEQIKIKHVFKIDSEYAGIYIFMISWIIIFSISMIIIWFNHRKTEIELTEGGMIYKNSKINKKINWNSIEEIKHRAIYFSINGITCINVNTLTVKTSENIIMKIDNYISYNYVLNNLIYKFTYNHLAEKYKKMFYEGMDIPFGRYVINKTGIRKENKYISWNDIKSVGWSEGGGGGWIGIQKKDGFISWGMVRTAKVINLHAVYSILETILKEKLIMEKDLIEYYNGLK